MEYIFEEEVGELGSEVEAYCQKCRTEGPHTVITRYEDEVRHVQCATCGHMHVYKPTRPEAGEEEVSEMTGRRRQVKKLSWDEAMRLPGSARARPYGFRDAYQQGDYLDHPRFGKGYVNEILDDTKIEAVFRDGSRVLAHNRKDLHRGDERKAAISPGKAHAVAARRPAEKKPRRKPRPKKPGKPRPARHAKRERRRAAPQRKGRPARVRRVPTDRGRKHRPRR